ncbi:MAG: ferredoxin--NADP reductase [Gallionella sp.]
MAAWNIGKVVGHKQRNKTLHSLYLESDIDPFKAGQFVKIALKVEGEVVERPYSLVNSPGNKPLEIYSVEVPNAPLTPHWVKLIYADEVLLASRAHGLMILDEDPKAKYLWLMATGTGIGPFLSILATEQCYGQVILVYAVRTLADLSDQDRISQIVAQHHGQFTFIPFLSSKTMDFALSARIPQAIIDGRLETHVDMKISKENSQIMLCGNPQMVKDTTKALSERGLKKHRRFDPGQITAENYW